MSGRRSAPGAGEPRADLHLHTLGSDGLLEPVELVRRCAEGGLDLIAITDHDLPPALPAGPQQVQGRWIWLLHGAELTATHRGAEIHILVYFPGQMPEDFKSFLVSRARARAGRYADLRTLLALPGLPPADEAAVNGQRALTRQHMARALVAGGHARHPADAWARVLNAPSARIPPVDLSAEEAIGVARQAGGITSWAHPDPDFAKEELGALAGHGLQGLEACRPRLSLEARSRLLRLAHQHKLLVTGGSDWHGWERRPPGGFAFPWREARPLARALGLGEPSGGADGPRWSRSPALSVSGQGQAINHSLAARGCGQ